LKETVGSARIYFVFNNRQQVPISGCRLVGDNLRDFISVTENTFFPFRRNNHMYVLSFRLENGVT